MGRDIEEIIQKVKDRMPNVIVSQLTVSHPGVDDDGLWYFKVPGVEGDIQLESSSGQCPFFIESTDTKSASHAVVAATIEKAVEEIISYLTN
jgi:hypothetical protein